MQQQLSGWWSSAIEQLGTAGAAVAIVLVVIVMVVFWFALLDVITAIVLPAAPERKIPVSPWRRLELRRHVDDRIRREATNVVEMRRQG